jgi:hypothetical protein
MIGLLQKDCCICRSQTPSCTTIAIPNFLRGYGMTCAISSNHPVKCTICWARNKTAEHVFRADCRKEGITNLYVCGSLANHCTVWVPTNPMQHTQQSCILLDFAGHCWVRSPAKYCSTRVKQRRCYGQTPSTVMGLLVILNTGGYEVNCRPEAPRVVPGKLS